MENEILRRNHEISRIWSEDQLCLTSMCEVHHDHWEQERQLLAQDWKSTYEKIRRGEVSCVDNDIDDKESHMDHDQI